ncbi:hypothetical protein [Streptomyces antimicrobicus]|uniref:Uncharacterized protein n=1 Tax=Streptomyces antimicrobicus TaxID=2883108 RepID=A0ABS8BAF5_9ACTN|nr:hypothetical protein [Streptomyces antimicrobicus]MCB5181548.1 hypothetical protein [Streptomyces antimicrobicus]
MSIAERADHVGVHLTGCDHETALAVFAVLQAAFEDPTAAERPADRAGSGAGAGTGTGAGTGAEGNITATVWSATVAAGVPAARHSTAPPPLVGPVTVELYGDADPVRHVREELERAFVVEHLGTVPGEHELETRLRLTAR